MHIRLFDRIKRRPSAELTPLTIDGDLPVFYLGNAFEGRIPFEGEIGDVVVESWTGELPPGATVTIDNTTKDLVVAWPAYQAENIDNPVPIPNADFSEVGGWSLGSGWSISGGVAFYTAHGDARIVSDTLSPVPPGRTITVSCDVFQGASSANACGGAVRLVWFDINRAWISENEGNIIKTSEGPTLSTLTASAPLNAAYVAPAANAFRRRQNKEMHIDNFAWNHYTTVGGNTATTYCITVRIRDEAARTADWSGCTNGAVDEILSDNPVGYWRLNDAGGSVASDSSGHGHHGVYSGNYSAEDGISTVSSGSMGMDGTSGSVIIAHDPAMFELYVGTDGSFTATATIEFTADTPGSRRMIVSAPDSILFGTFNFMLSLAEDGYARPQGFFSGGSPGAVEVIDNLQLPVNTPCILHWAKGADGSFLYLNGTEIASNTSAAAQTTGPVTAGDGHFGVQLGGYFAPGNDAWQGRMENVALFDYRLSAARILAHAQALGFA